MSCDRVRTKIMATMTVRKTTIIVLFVIENLRGTHGRDTVSVHSRDASTLVRHRGDAVAATAPSDTQWSETA